MTGPTDVWYFQMVMPKGATAVRKKPRTRAHASRVIRYGPPIPTVLRKVWVLGCETARVEVAVAYLTKAGHQARGGEPGGDVGAALRTERPDLVVIDMASE